MRLERDPGRRVQPLVNGDGRLLAVVCGWSTVELLQMRLYRYTEYMIRSSVEAMHLGQKLSQNLFLAPVWGRWQLMGVTPLEYQLMFAIIVLGQR
jgi:hypothetical protein